MQIENNQRVVDIHGKPMSNVVYFFNGSGNVLRVPYYHLENMRLNYKSGQRVLVYSITPSTKTDPACVTYDSHSGFTLVKTSLGFELALTETDIAEGLAKANGMDSLIELPQ